MIDQGRVDVLGIGIDVVDYEAAVHRIMSAAADRRAYSVSALAVHGVITGVDDPEHASRLNQLDLVTPDGQPVRWAMNLLHGAGLKDRVYGPKLTLLVCRAAAEQGIPVYFYGSNDTVLTHLRERLPQLAPGIEIAGMQPSKFGTATPEELDVIAAEVRASGAGICMVGLGCPRQEVFAFENAARFGMPLMAVGAAFDYHAGLQSEPPAFIQRWGFQWLYRLCQNPRRLWRRYLVLNPRYAWGIFQQMRGRHHRAASPSPAATPSPATTPSHVGWA